MKYIFTPNPNARKLLGLQEKYVGSDITSLVKQALGAHFKKRFVPQTVSFKEKFGKMVARVFVLKNPDETSDLKKLFELSSIGIVQLSD